MRVEEQHLKEVICCECKKPISTIPAWLAGAKVKFQCEECRQKHPRIPGMADVDIHRSLHELEELNHIGEVAEIALEEDELEEDDAGDEIEDYSE
jgi:hypothetical protein